MRDKPETEAEWHGLWDESEERLKARGLAPWDGKLYLLPDEWYDDIPTGLEIEIISGEMTKFDPEKNIEESRYGYLPFGVRP